MARKSERQGRVMLSHIHGSRYFEPVEYDGPFYLEPKASANLASNHSVALVSARFAVKIDQIPHGYLGCMATAPEGTPVTLVIGGFTVQGAFGPDPIMVSDRNW